MDRFESGMHIYIKNMVCNRCVKVVKEGLEKIGLEVDYIRASCEAEINSPKEIDPEKIKAVLEENGFELLEDKNHKLIEKVKTLIIDLIDNKKGEKLNQNYSDILSKEIGKDYHTISTLFSSTENITIEKYIILQKIERIKELIVYDELNLSEIAFRLGYSSVAHLSNQFKQVTGMSPSEFKKLRNKDRKPLDRVK